MRPIELIAAVAKNDVIGTTDSSVRYGIPWHVPADFKHFKAITDGGVLIMGRGTYNTIGKPVPGRKTIIISVGNPIAEHDDLLRVRSLDHATEYAQKYDRRIFIAGGAKVYGEALAKGLVDLMHISHIPLKPKGDVYFPIRNLLEYVPTSLVEKEGFTYATYNPRDLRRFDYTKEA